MNNNALINELFDSLKRHYGHLDWWHKDKPYEVMLGALLVQNTKWQNAQQALDNLSEALHKGGNQKAHKGTHAPFYPELIAAMPEVQLATLIRPSGYYNQKAKKIQALTHWFAQYGYDIEAVKQVDKQILRNELLAIKGIGGETADAILVYAIHKPSFVIDAYTRRIFTRYGLIVPKGYEPFREMIERSLPESDELYAYYHGLMVEHAQQFCTKTPQCEACPLKQRCLQRDE